MMRNENLIEGNLVVGGAATGKTTELANLTESFLLLNPDWHLLALGTHSYLEKLNPSIKYDPRHEIFTCVQINEITQIDFVDRIAEIRLQPDHKVLIVIDESLVFFSDYEARRRFVDLIIDANVDSESPRSVYTLIATQSFYDFGGLYSMELAANFTEYTLLRTPTTDHFFKISGVDTARIEKGIKFSLLRSKVHSHKYLVRKEKINFPTNIHTGSRLDFVGKFMHFSLLVLPLLVISFFYYYNAPSLDWMGVGNGEHSFSRKIFELPFILRALVTAAYYFFAFFLFLYSVIKTIILIKFDFDDVEPIFYIQKELGISVLLALLFSSALIFLNAVLSIVIEVPPYYPVGIN